MEGLMKHDIDAIIRILRESVKQWREPIISEMTRIKRDPYRILISTIISLRTKDDVTRESSNRLFNHADTPEKMLTLPVEEISKIIFPAGFYRNKAESIVDVSKTLVEKYDGKVPDTMDELLALKGVGRKTATLVLSMGFRIPAICVDTHVHRISNRLGYVKTKNPTETEFALMKKLPKHYWIEYNDLLVTYGQNLCKPISPHCSACRIYDQCMRVGVKKHR